MPELFYQTRGRIERLHQILVILRTDIILYNSDIKDAVESHLAEWEEKLKNKEQNYARENGRSTGEGSK